MELERRVDLRIRRPAECRESLGSQQRSHTSGTKEMPIHVEDLIVLNGFEWKNCARNRKLLLV
jgi:hypothetical protein